MEGKVIVFEHGCREILPIMDIEVSLSEAFVLIMGENTINVSIHKDNYGALVLSETLPPHFTLGIKHYATKTIWFCEDKVKHSIRLLKIDTVEQIGYFFTKGLPRMTFNY